VRYILTKSWQKVNFASAEAFLSSRTTEARLGYVISEHDLILWADRGSVPGLVSSGAWLFPETYVDRLANFLGSEIASIGRPTELYAKMCLFEYYGLRGQGEDYLEALRRLHSLVRRRVVCTTAYVARSLNRHRFTVSSWPENRFISSVTVGRTRFYPVRQIKNQKEALAWPDKYEVTERLGLASFEVPRKMVSRGKLVAIRTPEGWRFDPEALDHYLAGVRGWIPAVEARSELDVSYDILYRCVKEGRLRVSHPGTAGQMMFSEESVRALKEQLNTVQRVFRGVAGFDRSSAYSALQVARRLWVSDTIVYRWAVNDVLPYFDSGSCSVLASRVFPRAYIDRLAVYLRLQTPSHKRIQIALRYRQMCMEAGCIVSPVAEDA
jgi:hypothetical protein